MNVQTRKITCIKPFVLGNETQKGKKIIAYAVFVKL